MPKSDGSRSGRSTHNRRLLLNLDGAPAGGTGFEFQEAPVSGYLLEHGYSSLGNGLLKRGLECLSRNAACAFALVDKTQESPLSSASAKPQTAFPDRVS